VRFDLLHHRQREDAAASTPPALEASQNCPKSVGFCEFADLLKTGLLEFKKIRKF
jgi:hypothetical protein